MPNSAKCFAICLWMSAFAHSSVDAAARAPRSFDFEPTQFAGLFGPAKPVLNISPGDTVRTWTLDAEGFDSHGIRKVALVNPQTGPFYVETAMPAIPWPYTSSKFAPIDPAPTCTAMHWRPMPWSPIP
jgi:hypothetical protein